MHRLYQLAEQGKLLFPAINVNDSVTKSKFDNKYGIRHSLPDGINRATDVLMGGKVAVVCGYGDVGKGAAEALRGQGSRVIVTEIDPICALQAAMDGYQVATLESVLGEGHIFITTTGNKDVIMAARHGRGCGTRRSSATSATSTTRSTWPAWPRSRASRRWRSSRRSTSGSSTPAPDAERSIIVLSEGRLLNLGNATGHPSFVMSNSFANQTIAQIELFTKHGPEPATGEPEYGNQVYVLPKILDEKVARLHLDALGVELTELTKEQAEYLGLDVAGPYKPDHYRY